MPNNGYKIPKKKVTLKYKPLPDVLRPISQNIFDAINFGDIDRIRYLLEKGHVNHKSNGMVPILLACMNGNVNIVRLILGYSPDLDVYVGPSPGTTLLVQLIGHIVSRRFPENKYNDFIKILKLLLDSGADIDEMAPGPRITPLMAVILRNNLELLKILLKYHPNLYIRNFRGETVFDIASPEILNILNEYRNKYAKQIQQEFRKSKTYNEYFYHPDKLKEQGHFNNLEFGKNKKKSNIPNNSGLGLKELILKLFNDHIYGQISNQEINKFDSIFISLKNRDQIRIHTTEFNGKYDINVFGMNILPQSIYDKYGNREDMDDPKFKSLRFKTKKEFEDIIDTIKFNDIKNIKYFYENQSGRKEINYYTKRPGNTNSFGKRKVRLSLKQLKRDLKKVS